MVFKIYFNLFNPNAALQWLCASQPCSEQQLLPSPPCSAFQRCHQQYFHRSEDKTNYGLKTQPHKFFQIECDLPALKAHLYSAGGRSSVTFPGSGTGFGGSGTGREIPAQLQELTCPQSLLLPLPADSQTCVICFSPLPLQQTEPTPTSSCFLSLLG